MRLPSLPAEVSALLAPMVDRLPRARGRRQRRVWSGNGRAHIEVRGVHREGAEALLAGLEAKLSGLRGVHWAEVNAVLGRVVVAFDDDQVGVDDLIAVVEGVEEAHELHEERFPLDRPEHPADIEPVRRQVLAIGADTLGMALGVVTRVARATPLSAEAAALVSLVDASPRLRHQLETRVGPAAADLGLALASAVSQGLAQGPLGLGVDALHRIGLAREAAARRAVWLRREPELHGVRSGADAPVRPEARPVPLPAGPVELYADRAAAVGLAAAGAALAVTRQPLRAVTALATTTPKAARLTREAFAAAVGRAAAGRGVLLLDPQVLRRLDRVDTVVLDAAVLTTGRSALGPLVPVGDAVEPETVAKLTLQARALFAPDDPRVAAVRGAWALRPASKVPAARRGAGREVAARLRAPGRTVLALTRDDELLALTTALPELDPLAEALLTSARRVGTVVVGGVRSGLGERVGADRTVPGGRRLAASVRDLQRDGRVVALVSAQGSALGAADCGVGVPRDDGPPPWGAHVLGGPGLTSACLILDAAAVAPQVSRRGTEIALYGSIAGALLALAGPPRGAAGRALAAVNFAALAGLAAGTWSAATVTRRPEPLPADHTPWHALPAQQALERLGTSTAGLPAAEAGRRRRSGPPDEDNSDIGVVGAAMEELANPLTPALATGAGMSAASGAVTDAALIGTVMGVNAFLGGVQRVRAQRALRRLEDASAARVRLRRDGGELVAAAATLVPGDVIVLQAGDVVPADCRVLEATGVEADESSLTGESQLVAKTPEPTAAAEVADRSSMLYAGTVVAAGTALAAVVRTGPLTELGRSARSDGGQRRVGGVQARLRSLTTVTIPVALGAAGVLVGGGLLRGSPLRATLGTGVALAVAAVPEGLPLVATVAQLGAARRLSRRNALVRNPSTIEALGRVDVLCFDKTGTLTEGRIRLHRVSDGRSDEPVDALGAASRAVLAAALRASPEHPENGVLPHPTDSAVVLGGATAGVTADEGADGWLVVDELPFEPSRGYHAVLGRTADGHRLAVKGAPEVVLPRCAIWRRNGADALSGGGRRAIDAEVDRLARRGYRVLAVAERAASGRVDLDESRVDRLELLGLVALTDPVRPTAAEAVRGLRAAGVDVIIITGDHPSTAASIAAELDVLNGRSVATGMQLDALDDDALAELLATVSVFARVSPNHKVRIVRALQRAGRVVAVTGDGANDAPAIRLADVGVALGRRGTNAAREAADVVVADDRLETIIDAIVEGRAMWASVRDAISVLLGGNLGEMAFTLGAGLLLPGGSPLNARQLLLINLLTDMLPSMALAVRPAVNRTPETLLHEGPDVSLGAALTRDVLVRGAATAVAGGVGWTFGRVTGTAGQAGTVALVAVVGAQLAQTLLAGRHSPLVVAASLVSGAALVVVVQTPGVSHFFGCRPLTPLGWAAGLGAAGLTTGAAAAAPAVLPRIARGPSPLPRQPGSADSRGGNLLLRAPVFRVPPVFGRGRQLGVRHASS